MLDVSHLSITFSRYRQGLLRDTYTPVTDISLTVAAGEIVAVVGASGSGKSLLAHALLGLLPKNAQRGGSLKFQGKQLDEARMHHLRGREIALIPQSVAYLDPLMRVGSQVYRAACLSGLDKVGSRRSTEMAFRRYDLAPLVKTLLPFQLSGGMARRVLTAAATAGRAELIIADEPTTGLDPVVAEKTLGHLGQLAGDGKGVLLITHDLAAAVNIAQRVVVVYGGKTMEITAAANFLQPEKLLHPYTRALWQALPQNGFIALAGEQPSQDEESGCIFLSRCPAMVPPCRDVRPELQRLNGSLVRCPHAAY
jgi:peptide/nickel transport system ATP-binding protein